MNALCKILLVLLALPFIIVLLGILLPFLLFLLVLSFFIPSVRMFHIFRSNQHGSFTPHGGGFRAQDDSVDVECTVINSEIVDGADTDSRNNEFKKLN